MFSKRASLNPLLLIHALISRLGSDSLLRNSVYIMGSTVATSAIGYLYWIVAAHIYSPHDIGLASAFISAMSLTSIFANLGIDSALVQILPRREAGYEWSLTVNTCMAIGIFTSLLCGVVVAIALPFLSPQFAITKYHIAYTLFFILGVILCTIATLLDQTFVAERATGNMAVRNAVFALLKLVIMVLLVQIAALGIFSSWVIALGTTAVFAGLVLIPRLKRDYCFVLKGLVKQIRPLFASFAGHHFINIGGYLPMYLLPVFVAVRLSVTDNAYFYTTWMLGSLFFMVSPAVAMALFSEGSHSLGGVMHKARASIMIIGILLGPLLLVFLLWGNYIMSLFGSNYPQHGLLLLMILAISAVPDAITNIYVSLLRVQGRLYQAALLNLGMAAITLMLAWILLPTLGIAGAGWAWLIAQSVGSVIVGTDILILHRNGAGNQIKIEALNNIFHKNKKFYMKRSYIFGKDIPLMDTAVLSTVRSPFVSQTRGKEVISLIDTLILPEVRLPTSSHIINELDGTTDSYLHNQLSFWTRNESSFVEDETR